MRVRNSSETAGRPGEGRRRRPRTGPARSFSTASRGGAACTSPSTCICASSAARRRGTPTAKSRGTTGCSSRWAPPSSSASCGACLGREHLDQPAVRRGPEHQFGVVGRLLRDGSEDRWRPGSSSSISTLLSRKAADVRCASRTRPCSTRWRCQRRNPADPQPRQRIRRIRGKTS